MSGPASGSFREIGALPYRSVLGGAQVARIAALFDGGDRPGKRLSAVDVHSVADLIGGDGPVARIAIGLIGGGARPVRGLLFDKSEAANWRLGWHQDRTIAVRQRIDVAGFGRWSVKAGQLHVEPPHDVTAAMVTLRIHVDAVDEYNAPLEVVPGSHLLGRLTNDQVERVAAERAPLACLAEAGDVWAYSTAIVHASSEQRRPGRRRVLQLDYSTLDLPGGLEWMPLA